MIHILLITKNKLWENDDIHTNKSSETLNISLFSKKKKTKKKLQMSKSKKKQQETELEDVSCKVQVEVQGLNILNLSQKRISWLGCGFPNFFSSEPLVEYRSKRFDSIEPLRKNGCTDIPCLMIFVICITMWSYIGVYGKFFIIF